jgi:hypothetical protein
MTLIIYKDKLPRAQVAAEQAATAIWKARAGQKPFGRSFANSERIQL